MQKSVIETNQNYKTSTRIDSTSSTASDFIDSFIWHGSAISAVDFISKTIANSDQRAFTLTGPYGSGKSTLALYLSYLLSADNSERKKANEKLQKSTNELNDLSSRLKVKKGWTVVKHVYGLESPAPALLASIYEGVGKKFSKKKVDSLSDGECLEKIEECIAISSKDSDGFVLLLDELGKALDYQARNNKDLHFFQSLADIIQKSEKPTIVIGFLHQSFKSYANNKTAEQQNEWAKIQGRYLDISFSPSIEESLILVGQSISKDKSLEKKLINKHKALISDVQKCVTDEDRNTETLLSTLPLDPIVSLLLGPISKRRFSQNERSLFTFLSSQEKIGFQDFLASHYAQSNPELELFRPERLWDYLEYNLHHVITTSPDGKAWLEGGDAIYRAKSKGEELHVQVTKIIALLTIFGRSTTDEAIKLVATKSLLKGYLKNRGHSDKNIISTLESLEKWGVIIFQKFRDSYSIFGGSDIDINALVSDRVESIKEGVDWTKNHDSSSSILATRHYHQTGTMRWANTVLVKSIDHELLERLSYTPQTGEPFLTYILSVEKPGKSLLDTAKKNPYICIAHSKELQNIKPEAIELLALKQIEKDSISLNFDNIAKKEIKSRISQYTIQVEHGINKAFIDARWTYQGELQSKSPLSTYTSNIADRIFTQSPVIFNELINRSKPSGSANSALNKLMQLILDNGDQPDLGFPEDLFPPEKGIYLSCIKDKGWHQDTNEGTLFTTQWSKGKQKSNQDIYNLIVDGIDFIKTYNNGEMVTLNDLFNYWKSPPFGLTHGICRLYSLALLKSLEGKVSFYDKDSTNEFIFIPELDEQLVEKINKHTHEIGVRYFETSKIQAHLVNKLAAVTIGKTESDDKVLNIAKHISKIVHTLPRWVRNTSGNIFSQLSKTQSLSKEAKFFRNKVIKANDPYRLLLEELPEIFNINPKSSKSNEALSNALKSALDELNAQHPLLIDGFLSILRNTLDAKIDSKLRSRCEFVSKNAQSPTIKDFSTRLIKHIDGKVSFEHVISLATEAPEKSWTDTNIQSGLDKLKNLCLQFRRIESFSTTQAKSDQESKAISLISTDTSGKYLEYESFYSHKYSKDKEVKSTIKTLERTIKGLPKEKSVAALTELLSSLMEESGADL